MDELEKEGTLEEPEEGQGAPEGEEAQEGEDEGTDDKQAAKDDTGSAPEVEEKITPKVQQRIDHLTWEKNEYQRKFQLFKTNPDQYFEQYPEERPPGYQPRQAAPEENAIEDYESMLIKGGQYDGMTLGELAREKPLTAQRMLNDHLEGQKRAKEEVKEKEVLSRQAWENDVNSFGASLSKEVYGRDKDELTKEEFDAITQEIFKVDQWKKANRKDHYSYHDAYALMNRESELKQAKEGGAKKVVQDLKKKPIGTISGKTDQRGQSTDYESMSREALNARIMEMNDAETEKFYREAPESLRQKYPSWPWS